MEAPERRRNAGEAESEMMKLSFRVSREWHDDLAEAAKVQGVSIADLCRLVLRQWLRNRYPDDERAVLER